MQSASRRRAYLFPAYFVLHVGFHAAARAFEVSPGISLWYPPAGLALALVTILGWPAVPVVLIANACSALMGGFGPAPWLDCTMPVFVTAIYSLAGGIVRHFWGPLPHPTQPLSTLLLLMVFIAAPATAAVLGTVLVAWAGLLKPGAEVTSLVNWWVGDFTGIVTVVPLCLVHAAPWLLGARPGPGKKRPLRRVVAAVAEAVLLLGCVWLVNGLESIRDERAYYLCFIPLVVICLRHGLPGATIATCTLTMASLAALNVYDRGTEAGMDVVFFVISVSAIGLGLGWSVSRRTQAERERSRLLEILEATTDFVGTCDLDGRITYANSAFLNLRGYTHLDKARGVHAREAYPPWAAEKVFNEGVPTAIREGTWHGETAVLDREGQEVPISQVIVVHYDAELRPVTVSTVARDIREQKKAERARLESERNLLQAQKLESLGVLAGGIAHDFNNLLTVMLGNATLARIDLPINSPGEQAIHQIELAALRAAELCRQMLAYSGKSRLTTELIDVSHVVEQTIHLLKVSIAKKCVLEFALSRDLPPIHGDATQLSQIAMNLVMNASDASQEHGGRIVVRTGLLQADRAYLTSMYLPLPAEPGPYVFLEVTDQGCGMTDEVLRRMFEPFYTTKFSGHGLGLSAVLGIVRSHRGAVKVESRSGEGTTFRVLFPAAAGRAVKSHPDVTAIEGWRGSGRVLVVDDEESVRDIACRILARFGFEPVAAFDGRDGVELFSRDPGGYAAVLMDLSMPSMDGREACREIHALNSAIPVVLMSGYNHSKQAEQFATDQFAGFIQKPFEAAHLMGVLREILHGRGRDATTAATKAN